MEKHRVDFASIPWESPAAGVRFKAYRQGGRRLRLVEFSKEFIEPDWCRKGHIGMVLEGEAEVDFDGRAVRFSAGDGVFIPPGQAHKHKARVLTDKAVLILVEDE